MIESEQNSKVRLARSLQRRRERERQGLLFLEGLRLVHDALDGGPPPHLLIYTAAAPQQPEIQARIERHRDAAWQVSEGVLQHMADTVSPQGIAAIVPLPELAWPSDPTLLLVTDQIRDPGNLGTLLRTAAAAGVEGVLLTRGSVDPWSDKVLRAGMGAHFRLPLRSRQTWEEIERLTAGLTRFVAEAGVPRTYDEVEWQPPTALIVGGEAHGPSEHARRLATLPISIPMTNQVESLNAAMAGGIILFEARRQRRRAKG